MEQHMDYWKTEFLHCGVPGGQGMASEPSGLGDPVNRVVCLCTGEMVPCEQGCYVHIYNLVSIYLG